MAAGMPATGAAAPHNKGSALRSYNVVGTVRDMSDFITNLDPDKTKLTQMFGKTSVVSTKHEWLRDSLRPAMVNKHPEVINFDTTETVPRRWMYNTVQQFMHGYNISDITQAIKKYGVRDEVAYQFVKAGKEIASDLEYAIVNNTTATPMSENVAGTFGGIPYFLEDELKGATVDAGVFTLNDHGFVNGDALIVRGGTECKENVAYYVAVKDANTFYLYDSPEGAMNSVKYDANGHGVSSGEGKVKETEMTSLTFQNCIDAAKDVAKGNLTFDLLNDAMQLTWQRGGDPTVAIMSARNKRGCADFTQGALPIRQAGDKSITTSLEIIETDFGSLRLEAHRMYSDDVVDLLDPQYWKLGYLIPFHTEEPPRVGTYKEKVITGVASIECTAPNANARIKNLTGKVNPKPVVVETITPTVAP